MEGTYTTPGILSKGYELSVRRSLKSKIDILVSFDTIWYQEVFMPAMTLRLEPTLAKKLDKVCRKHGYKKAGVIKSLIKNFVEEESKPPLQYRTSAKGLESLVGIVKLGGDAVEDADSYCE